MLISKKDHDRIRPISTVDGLENQEIALFYNTTKDFAKANIWTPEYLEWLRKEFEKYIKNLRLIYQEAGANYLLADFFQKIPENGWMIIRRDKISHIIRERNMDKSRRILLH